jgi:hypothetical protein
MANLLFGMEKIVNQADCINELSNLLIPLTSNYQLSVIITCKNFHLMQVKYLL